MTTIQRLFAARTARVNQLLLLVAVMFAALTESYPRLSGLNFAVIFLSFVTAADRSPFRISNEPAILRRINRVAVFGAFVLIAVSLISLMLKR